ncbi:MAG: hypothetical protein ACFE8Z_01635 [Candidatus Hermodarchaeota archaeon]
MPLRSEATVVQDAGKMMYTFGAMRVAGSNLETRIPVSETRCYQRAHLGI